MKFTPVNLENVKIYTELLYKMVRSTVKREEVVTLFAALCNQGCHLAPIWVWVWAGHAPLHGSLARSLEGTSCTRLALPQNSGR